MNLFLTQKKPVKQTAVNMKIMTMLSKAKVRHEQNGRIFLVAERKHNLMRLEWINEGMTKLV